MSINNITEATFAQSLETPDKVIMIDFWASWCGPCKALAPILDELAPSYARDIDMYKASIEEEPVLAANHMVMSVPTLVFYRNGEKIKSVSGGKSREEIVALFEELKQA